MSEPEPQGGPDQYDLASQLQREVEERLGRPSRVHLALDLTQIANQYLPTTEPLKALVASAAQPLGALLQSSPDARAAVLEALFEASSQLRLLRFIPDWDPRSADVIPPEYDLELPEWMDQPTLNEIAGPSELVVSDATETQTPGDWLVTTHHLARLTFDGFASKADYYGHDDPDVVARDPDWNDHMVHIATARIVAITSTVRCTVVDDVVTKADVVQITDVVLVSSSSPD